MVIEYACEKCGAPLMKPATATLHPNDPRPQANVCDHCGHFTALDDMKRFQWSTDVASMVNRLLYEMDDRKRLRLNPAEFMPELNRRLRAERKPELEVDASSSPLTIRTTQ
jgi:hypothetical protein